MGETGPRLDVSVVLPCHNEQDHVQAEVDRICSALEESAYSFEVLAIDDGSTDDTLSRLRESARTHPEVEITSFRRNGGAGTARRIGTTNARGRIVVWTDADMTYPNDRIPELVRILDEDESYDQVVGARTSEQGTLRILRVPAKWFVRKLAERLTGERIPDLNSGLRAFRREVAQPFLPLLPPGFSCVTTITLSFLSNQHDIKYVPIEYRPRAGRSKFSPVKDAYRYLLQVFRMVMYFNPLSVLMPPALILVGLAIIKAFVDVWRTPFYVHTNTIVLFLTGLIIATLALLADLIVRSRPRG